MPTSKKRAKHRLTPAQQHKRFLEAAKEAEVDPKAFDAAFKRLNLRNKATNISRKSRGT
jgi:hypothetical protein